MDRSKNPVSVVPYPLERTSNSRVKSVDEHAAWDSQWLRPKVSFIEKPKVEVAAMTSEKKKIEQLEEKDQASLPVRILRWLFPDVNERRATRYPTPGLVAFYWTGGAPHSYQVGDMSATGLFLLTKERWAPGTLIQMTLQRQDGRPYSAENSICVLSEVVRWGENGAGFNFVLTDYENVLDYGILPGEATDRRSVERFLLKIGAPIPR